MIKLLSITTLLFMCLSGMGQLSTNQKKQVTTMIATADAAQLKLIQALQLANKKQSDSLTILDKKVAQLQIDGEAYIQSINEQQGYIDDLKDYNKLLLTRLYQMSDSTVSLYKRSDATNTAVNEAYGLATRNRGLINDGKAATDLLATRLSATELVASQSWAIAKEIWTIILPPEYWIIVTDPANKTKTLTPRK